MNFDKLYKLANIASTQPPSLPALDGKQEIYYIETDFFDLIHSDYLSVRRMTEPRMIEMWNNHTHTHINYQNIRTQVIDSINRWSVSNGLDKVEPQKYRDMPLSASKNLDKLFKPYQVLHGKWGCYNRVRGGRNHIIGFEVDVPYYSMKHILDAGSEGVSEEDNILDW